MFCEIIWAMSTFAIIICLDRYNIIIVNRLEKADMSSEGESWMSLRPLLSSLSVIPTWLLIIGPTVYAYYK